MLLRLLLVSLGCAAFLRAEDWPQFLGPHRNGVSDEEIAGHWETQPPKVLWNREVGAGFSGPLILNDTIFLFHRKGTRAILTAWEASSGKQKWENEGTTSYEDDFGFDEGPRSTPCLANGNAYAMGAEGLIRCVSLADGKTVWTVDARRAFQAEKGFFGMVCSPLVCGGKVLLNVGGDAGVVALDANTGKLLWKAMEDEASYSSPVAGSLDGKFIAAFFTREGLAVLDPETGQVLAKRPWRARINASVNAAAPLLVGGDRVFVTASYGTGALLARFDGASLHKIWSSDDSLSCHYATPVEFQGFLYGFHGRQETGPSFRCVELQTGQVRWDEAGFRAGSVTRARDHLLILREGGELLLVGATPTAFEIKGRCQILGAGTRAFPAVSDHRLFARDKRQLVCVQLP